MAMAGSADLAEIQARLEPLLGTPAGDPEPLDGGITNRNYRARLGGRDYVIRLPGKDTALLGISREAERVANATAARLGIAPEVAAAFEDCLVTRFVPSRAVSAAELAAAPGEAARALRAFHEDGPRLPTRFWVPELVESYAAIVQERGGELPPGYADAREVAGRIAAVRPLMEPVPCHNDLLTANLIRSLDGALLLVDWEYAGMGERFFDLGNLSINNEFDEDADLRLLEAYFEREPEPGELAELALMRAMSDVREATWGVVQGAISELDFDFQGYAAEHFGRLRRTAEEPRFEEWLHAASA
jgi:thiamine kinase-like enzyme